MRRLSGATKAATMRRLNTIEQTKKTTQKKCFFVLLCVVIVIGVWQHILTWRMSFSFPMTNVQVSVVDYNDAIGIEKKLNALLENRNFFSINLIKMRHVLEQSDWIEFVTIRKKWPDELHVFVQGQQPVALWNEQWLMNHKAELFAPFADVSADDYGHLVRLQGPQTQQKLVFASYKKMKGLLSPYGVRSLTLNNIGDLTVALDNGLSLFLGRDIWNARVKRFHLFYPALKQQTQRSIRYLDFRYSVGVVVGWQPQELLESSSNI